MKVAETRSFAETARQMGVSQPAVSQTIARLEELYGGDLFERRRGSPTALTPIGRAILPKAKLLLFTVDQQIDRALATAQSLTGTLAVGVHPGLALGPLSNAIADIRSTRPDVRFRLVEASPNELFRQLNERLLDIVFTGFLPQLDEGMNIQERLWAEPLIAVVPSDHPLAGGQAIRWTDLAPIPLILRSHHGDLSSYRALAARLGDQSFECDLHDVSRATLIEMVRLGLGVAVLFASATAVRDGVTFLPIQDENALIWIEALYPAHDRNPLRHHLLACVRSHAAGHSNADDQISPE